MILDVIPEGKGRDSYPRFTAYVQLPEGQRPGDADDNAIARQLQCDADDLSIQHCRAITEPNDTLTAEEYTLWQAALEEQQVLWRLRGLIH